MTTRRLRSHRGALLALASASLLAVASPPCFGQAPSPADAADPGEEFRRLIDARQYEQAVAKGEELVAAAEKRPGDNHEYLQVSLMNLALAQYLDQDYVGAEASYLRVIDLIEAAGGMPRPRLARAQAGLANTYFAGRRYDLAVARYEQAISLARREQGLFTQEQIPSLEKYATALTELDRIDDAMRAQRYILHTVEHKYGVGSIRYAQALESLGRWYTRVGLYDSARASLRNSIDTIERLKGDNAVELIGPLTALGNCARRQLLDPATAEAQQPDQQRRTMFDDPIVGFVPTLSPSTIAAEGEKSLERAAAIATGQTPPAQALIADVRTQLGDWYQSQQKQADAMANYGLAWQAASTVRQDGKPLTELLFGRPVLVSYVPPTGWNRYAGRPAGEADIREVAVDLTVTARGRVMDATVISDGGDPKRGAQTLRALQSAVYRPRFDQGVPADTKDVTLNQPYYVLVAQSPKPESSRAPDDTAGNGSSSPAAQTDKAEVPADKSAGPAPTQPAASPPPGDPSGSANPGR